MPYGKELVPSNIDSSEYDDITTNFSDGLEAYWKFNEANYSGTADEVKDSSGNGHHGKAGGSLSNEQGILGNAFPRGNGLNVTFSAAKSPELSKNLTLHTWIKGIASASNSWCPIFQKADWGTAALKFQMINASAGISLRIESDVDLGYTQSVSSTSDVFDNTWHHVVVTIDGVDKMQIYIDGKWEASRTVDLGSGINASSESALFGCKDENFSIDEFAIWTKTLSASDIKELYQRGANRVKYQVRTCSDSNCSTDPEWQGPGGDSTTSFSEMFNLSSASISNLFSTCDSDDICSQDEFSYTENSLNNLPEFKFIDSLVNNYSNLSPLYFQYRVLLEAEDNTACNDEACLPEVEEINFTHTNTYFRNAPSITTLDPITITGEIKKLKFEKKGNCTVKYQLSKDGSNFYYYSGSWMLASDGVAQANTASEITSKISDFISSGSLFIRAYLQSDGSQACTLSNLQISY